MRLPDDLFNLVFTFLDSIEIMAWTAESVRTKHAIARKLCKIVNGLDMESLKKAMKVGIEVMLENENVLGISAGNYGGKLGDYKIHLKELFP